MLREDGHGDDAQGPRTSGQVLLWEQIFQLLSEQGGGGVDLHVHVLVGGHWWIFVQQARLGENQFLGTLGVADEVVSVVECVHLTFFDSGGCENVQLLRWRGDTKVVQGSRGTGTDITREGEVLVLPEHNTQLVIHSSPLNVQLRAVDKHLKTRENELSFQAADDIFFSLI